MSITLPTNLPTGDRRTTAVTGLTLPRPTTLPGVYRAAARILAANGLHQGDYFPDALGADVMDVPYTLRPLSIVAA
ncbi:MAG TPA: hypothetical protein VFG16_21275, partial [Streptomyces sp.]|nr:hypothetical protein [Streptomyces sp.]